MNPQKEQSIHTDNDNGRLFILIIQVRCPFILPILALTLSMLDTFRSADVRLLFMTLQPLQRRKQDEDLPLPISLQQPHNTSTTPHLRRDICEELNPQNIPKSIHIPNMRCSKPRRPINFNLSELRPPHEIDNVLSSVDGAEIPGHAEVVAPIAILQEQAGDGRVVFVCDGGVELLDYMGGDFVWVDGERRAGFGELAHRDVDGAGLDAVV